MKIESLDYVKASDTEEQLSIDFKLLGTTTAVLKHHFGQELLCRMDPETGVFSGDIPWRLLERHPHFTIADEHGRSMEVEVGFRDAKLRLNRVFVAIDNYHGFRITRAHVVRYPIIMIQFAWRGVPEMELGLPDAECWFVSRVAIRPMTMF